MRKLVLIGAGAGGVVAALAALIVLRRSSPAQQAASPAAEVAAAVALAASDTAKLPGPRQPIFFRHDIHAGQFEIPCQYCHYSVSVATEPGIPSVQSCMGCHLVIGGTDSTAKAEIKKVRQAWADRKPMEWVRVHRLAQHAHFSHARHVQALGSTGCFSCHGNVTRMPQVFQANNINNMGWCITCHLQRQVNRDCTACHY